MICCRGRAALGGRHRPADRTRHAQGRVRARLRLVPPGREPAACCTSCAWPRRTGGASAPCRFAELYVDPAHGNYDPVHRIIRRAAQRLRPAARWPVRRTELPVAGARRPDSTASRWTGSGLTRRRRARRATSDPRLTGEMTARLAVGDTAVNLAATGLVLNAWILTGEPRYRRLDRELRRRLAGPRRGQRRHHPGQRRPGRRRRQHAGRPLVRRALRLDLAARLVQRRPGRNGRGTGGGKRDRRLCRSSISCARPWTRSSPTAVVMAFADSDSSLSSKWGPQLREDVAVPTSSCRSGTPTAAGSTTTRCSTSVPMALWHLS